MDAFLFNIMLLASCAIATFRGGAPEKIASGLLLTSGVLSYLSGANPHGFQHVEWDVFGIDCALLAALFVLAMRANRYWPLWITSMQLATVFSHLALAALNTRMPWAYATAETIWSFPMVAILAIGALRHHTRKTQFGVDLPWSGFSAPSAPATLGAGPTG